jgi:spermidine synthase
MGQRRLFLLLYTASGAAALVYEISWTRLLTLLMGQTVAAASTVLAAMMGGLALGSWIAARIEQRWPEGDQAKRALYAYAALEILVAIAAVLVPSLLRASSPPLAWAYGDGAAPVRFGLVRALLAMILVGVPATAMGATFPLAVTWYAGVAADAGLVYAVNTAGAALGALATGFWLIPALGIRATTYVGVVLNVAAAAGARWIAGHPSAEAGTPQIPARKTPPRRSKGARAATAVVTATAPAVAAAPRLAMAAAAVSGACAMIYEVIWTRLAALVMGPTTYAFATVVTSFIIGLAIGAALAARLLRRVTQSAVWLGATLIAGAVAAVTAGWFAASQLPLAVAGQVAAADAAFAPIVTRQALGTVLLLLPMTLSFGAAFPLALATASPRGGDVSASAAGVYVANTLGAIAGSLAGGFVLLPGMGLHGSLRFTAASGVVAAAAVWAAEARSGAAVAGRWSVRAAAVVCAAALLVLLPPWNLQLLAGGAYKYAPYIGLSDLENDLQSWRLLYLEDGSAATVSVRELAGQRSLVIDGKVDASNMGDMLTQRLLGLLPVLLHRHPEDVLVLGLGSGVTAASALAPGHARGIDIVEISPEVVKASDLFAAENGGVLRAPGVNLIVGDGRSHLAFTTRRYDVVVSEPSNPWMAGIAALFTREFFETARQRLKPDAIICQWAHTYDIGADDLASIVRTFTSVFPESTMWLVGDGDLLLIGTNGPSIEAHLANLPTRWRDGTAPALLQDVGLSGRHMPFLLLSMLAGGPSELRQYGEGAAVQTDDRMALEFSAPRAIYGRSSSDNAIAIRRLAEHGPSLAAARAAWDRATDADWAAAGAMELKADAYEAASDRFLRALTLNSANAEALAGLSDASGGARRQADARAWLEARAAAEPANVNVRIELSRILAANGDLERAATAASDAMRLAPDDERAATQLASVFADAGDGKRLAPFVDAMIARFPHSEKARFYRAHALFLNGNAQQAAAEMRAFVARHPDDARAQNLLGVACATVNDRTCAREAFAAALRVNRRDAETYVNLGVLQMQSGDPASAAEQFAVAATLDRTSTAARQGLQDARAALAAAR